MILRPLTEDDVLALPPGEGDTFERKGSRLLDLTLPNVKVDAVLNELAKQLSAFANTGGGLIIYGLTDSGTVDGGGVARSIKGTQSTKDWLEDIVPTLTDFSLVGFRVHEIEPKKTGPSSIDSTKSLFVVEVPDSEQAPHQSKRDLKYYIRLSGKSHPASHRIIEDIRNRARHPQLELHNVRISKADATPPHTDHNFKTQIIVNFGVHNVGKMRAANACLRFSADVPISGTWHPAESEAFLRDADTGTVLLELKNPMYPGMGIVLTLPIWFDAEVQEPYGGFPTLSFGGHDIEGVSLSVKCFADSAPAREQTFRLVEIDPEKQLQRVVEQEVERIKARGRFSPPLKSSPWL